MMVKFLELLKPYEGTTHSEIYGGWELTYQERLEYGQDEIDMLWDDEGSFRNYIIEHADYDYDDCYKMYGGMVIMSVEKETGNIYWWLRED
jgi:hypothetical protein